MEYLIHLLTKPTYELKIYECILIDSIAFILFLILLAVIIGMVKIFAK